MSIVLDSMLHQSFNFDATSYEIYENGCCIQHAPCDTHISAEYSIFTGMKFSLTLIPQHYYKYNFLST